jgi:hypothetical protein
LISVRSVSDKVNPQTYVLSRVRGKRVTLLTPNEYTVSNPSVLFCGYRVELLA